MTTGVPPWRLGNLQCVWKSMDHLYLRQINQLYLYIIYRYYRERERYYKCWINNWYYWIGTYKYILLYTVHLQSWREIAGPHDFFWGIPLQQWVSECFSYHGYNQCLNMLKMVMMSVIDIGTSSNTIMIYDDHFLPFNGIVLFLGF